MRSCPIKLELYHVLSISLSPILLRSTSIFPVTIHSQHLTPLHWCILTSPPYMLEPSKFRFSHFILHRGHSYLILNIFISNLISLSVPTHPTQHPHFYNFQLLSVGVLDWPTFCSIQHSRSNHYSVELAFNFWWHLLIT
uniref:Putative ovule protein n=1 Tax=Solanum chacoense TaxID=4108 RepID=A0A0V0HF16_SOLCH